MTHNKDAPPSAPVGVDGCTESNCPRCLTHPDHRGDMAHAGIGGYPTQQPAQAAPGDGVVGFRAAFFVSRDGNRIEQLTTYEDYRRDGALLALMDAGQKRVSAKGLTKKGGGKVVLAWVTALDPTPPGDDAAGGA